MSNAPHAIQRRLDSLAAMQGANAVERDLLTSTIDSYEPVESSGTNETYIVYLNSGTIAFHKPFAGVDVSCASLYGHGPDEPPLHEAAAWRLGEALGTPYSDLVAVCVLRGHADSGPGSLSLMVEGESWLQAEVHAPEQAHAAGFFDALVAQQDRHRGNQRFDGTRLGLIDHGFAFATPGSMCNFTAFVQWRHTSGASRLDADEHRTLERLLGSSDLLGLAPALGDERAQALADRAARMRDSGDLLRPGSF